ncbi:MAG: alanine racemase [Bdellovibrionales bacterium]|nr:alanine racemase [Bdellovibrionales bacterium]
MAPSAILEINLKALKENCSILKKLSGANFFCPMVKTQGYGHGIVPVTQALFAVGVEQVGVVAVSEARALRKALPNTLDILVFGPVLNKEDLDWLYENKCVLVANNWKDLEYWSKKGPSRIHVKFDTGFSRLGFHISEAEILKTFFIKHPHIRAEGLCSQLLSGEELGQETSASYRQMERMEHLISLFSFKANHLFNTAALLSSVCYGGKMNFGSRPGIGLYGIKPKIIFTGIEREKKWKEISLKPTSSLKSRIVGVHKLEKGEAVSYEGTWKAGRSSIIVVVSLGYGDGFPRALSSPQGSVLFRGKIVPVAGRVCMDFFMVDVTDVGGSFPILGEEVVIFGTQEAMTLSPEEQAEKASTVSHELFVRLGDRVKRHYF